MNTDFNDPYSYQKEPDPYCYHCNGTGQYCRADGTCHCTKNKYIPIENPKQAIDMIWEKAIEKAKEPLKINVYHPDYNDPIKNFVKSLAYCDWFDDKSQKWIDDFITVASEKLKEHFKG